jgi:hypothetical protein
MALGDNPSAMGAVREASKWIDQVSDDAHDKERIQKKISQSWIFSHEGRVKRPTRRTRWRQTR